MPTTTDLSQFELFAGLDAAQLAPLQALAEERSYAGGDVLLGEEDQATHVFILLEGKVVVQVQQVAQPQRIEVAVLNRPGHLVGWSGLVAPHYYTATAVCKADSRLLAMEGEALLQALEADPEMGFVVMLRIAGVISSRLRNLQQHILTML